MDQLSRPIRHIETDWVKETSGVGPPTAIHSRFWPDAQANAIFELLDP